MPVEPEIPVLYKLDDYELPVAYLADGSLSYEDINKIVRKFVHYKYKEIKDDRTIVEDFVKDLMFNI